MSDPVTDPPGGRWRRLCATAIDDVLVPLLSLFLVMFFGVVEHAEDYQDNWWMLHVLLLAIVAYLLLNGLTLWRSGQTLGKKVMRIRVADADPSHAVTGFWKLILARAWFFPLLFAPLFLGPVFPWLILLPVLDQLFIFGKTQRCLHDPRSASI